MNSSINNKIDLNLSIIIPHKNQLNELIYLLKNMLSWDLIPSKVIVIDSSTNKFHLDEHLVKELEILGILIQIIKVNHAYPGMARNIGFLASKTRLVAFLDVSTLPDTNWLFESISILNSNLNYSGVWGRTVYVEKNKFNQIIKFATFGALPLITVPGTIIKREFFSVVGYFIESTRAGEDTDWIGRVNLHKINMANTNRSLLKYSLNIINIKSLIYKWYRNYLFTSRLPYFNAHKSIYYHFFILLLLIFAFNWNWIVAGWERDNFLYFPNITKITAIIILFLYLLVRGVLLPFRKGVNIYELLPYKWLAVASISLLLDITKMWAFFKARISNV